MTPPTAASAHVDSAIERAQTVLLSCQAPDGHWVGQLEADSTITSEYLLFCHLLGRVDRERERKMLNYLRQQQLPDGGFNLYDKGPANLSATIKAYFAMKVAGVPSDDPIMAAARARIREWGGPTQASVFTKILLALFGEYDWSGVPAMPVEIMLLPRWSYFNLLEVSYWSRTVIVPLLILMDVKPVQRLADRYRLDELWVVPREQASLRFHRVPRPFSPKTFIWKNFFIGVDDCLKGWERLGPRPFRARAVEAARRWLEERLAVPGGLGGIFPAMTNAVLALRALGYPDDHPLIRGQIKEIENLGVESAHSLHYQPCVSAVWDTSLAANALVESGLPADHPQLGRAAEWMMNEQITVPGDWQVKRPHVPPGGWPFQYSNDFYPDLDDTAMVMMALVKIQGVDPERKRRSIERGLEWFLGMQGSDGGWASFDADNSRLIFNNIPFADHGALLDPSTEDLTGRGLELLGTLGYGPDHPAARRALGFIRRTQSKDGSW
jgi:squalene-hopene/tetraprenyl-beta-curcumene cyclase